MDYSNNVVTEQPKKKSNKLPFILIIIAFILIGSGVGISLTSKQEAKPAEKPKKEKEEVIQLTPQEAGDRVISLTEIGAKIYQDGTFVNYPQDSMQMNYITLGQLKELGYDKLQDQLVKCEDNDRVLLIDSTRADQYPGSMPILATYDCSSRHQ